MNSLIPEDIKEKLLVDAIMLKKLQMGWRNVHDEILKPNEYENRIQDLFCTDETGQFLDDICDEITYW